MTDQTQSEPPPGAGDGPEPTGDVPATGPEDATEESAAELAPVVTPPPPSPSSPEVTAPPPVPLPPVDTTPPPVPSPPVDTTPPPVPSPPEWRPEDDASAGGPAALAAERPEVAVGAAFAGGLVLALILKRLAR